MSDNHAVVVDPDDISLAQPWTDIARVAQDLMARRYSGKAVLTLE